MAERKPAKKSAQKSVRSTRASGDKLKGFTDEERAAMRERVQELKARPGAGKEDGESAVLAKIAEMPAPDRAMGERLHAISLSDIAQVEEASRASQTMKQVTEREARPH